MTSKKDISELTKTVSKRVQLPPEQIYAFIKIFFEQIEKGLIRDSNVKVEGIGLFRIIKSGNSVKILYLADSKKSTANLNIKETNKFEENSKFEETNKRVTNQFITTVTTIEGEKKIVIEPEIQPLLEKEIETKDEVEQTSSIIETLPEKEFEVNLEEKAEKTKKVLVPNSNIAFQNNINRTQQYNDDDDKTDDDSEVEESNYYQAATSEKSYKGIKIGGIAAFIMLIIGGVTYFTMPDKKTMPVHIPFTPMYSVMPNNDSIVYSHIIIAESTIDLLTLSKKYYGNDVFWPYIFNANNESIEDPFEIMPGTTIRIPRLDSALLDTTNQIVLDSLKILSNNILTIRTEVITLQ